MAAAVAEAPLCEYEQQRAERVKRNKQAWRPRRGGAWSLGARSAAFAAADSSRGLPRCCAARARARTPQIMASLGLFDEDVALAALMRKSRAEGGAGGAGGKKRGEGGAGRKRAAAEPAEPQRRSQRVAGVVRALASAQPCRSTSPLTQRACACARALPQASDEQQLQDACGSRELHEAEAEGFELRHAGQQRRRSVVGTASYEHTLMRCAPRDCTQPPVAASRVPRRARIRTRRRLTRASAPAGAAACAR
jgi:hypothetical protein